MSRKIGLVLVLALACVQITTTPFASADDETASVVVEGRVLDGDGEPLAGAEVLLREAPSIYARATERWRGDDDPWIASVRSDGAGAYRLEAPGAGVYEVRVRAPGHVPREIFLAPLVGDRVLDDVRLPRGREIEVTVADARGKVVEGALLTTLAPAFPDPGFTWRPANRAFRTDAEGRTVMRIGEDLSRPFDRELRVVAPGFAPASLEIVEPRRRWVVELEAGVERKLVVRDPMGEKAADVLVLLGDTRLPVGRTGEDGALAVSLPADGTTQLRLADAAGHYLMDRELAAGGDETLSFDLEELRPVAGQVVGSLDGEPLAGAWVWPYGRPAGVARSDERGEFEIVPLPGVPVARAGAAGHMPGRGRLLGDDVRIELQPAARLQGRVQDAEGRGLPGLRVEARPALNRFGRSAGRGSGGSARTGEDGRFALDALVPGASYEVEVDAAGWAPARKKVAALPDGSPTTVKIVLHPGITGVGTVLDESDAPVEGATVALRESRSASIFPVAGDDEDAPVTTAVTDAAGLFELRDLAAGAYRLEVDAPGFAPALVPGVEVSRPLSPEDPPADLGTVILSTGAEIRGVVVDADGVPIPGVAITCEAVSALEGLRRGEPRPPDTHSGEDGRFVVRELVPGRSHQIVARLEGMAEARLSGIEPTRAEAEEVEIVLHPASTGSGRVLGADDSPIEGAEVRVRQTIRRGPVSSRRTTGRATTDAEGRFEIGDLNPGILALSAEAEGWVPASLSDRTLRPGESLEGLELRLDRGVSLAVRVVDADDLPVEGASVMAYRESGSRDMLGHAFTESDGRGTLEAVPTGRLRIGARHGEAGEGQTSTLVEAGVENEVLVRLEAGTEISGQVIGGDGLPVAGARVWIGRGALAQPTSESSTDADGRFVLREVQGGKQNLYAEKGDVGRTQREIEVGEEPLHELLLQLEPTVDLVGELLGLDFDEVAAAEVLVLGGGEARRGTVKHDGSYRVEDLAPGSWQVIGEAGGRNASARAEVEAGMGEHRLDLDFGQGSESLEGWVTLDGQPLEGAAVRLRTEDRAHGAVTDYRGAFLLEGLVPGSATLEVSHRGAHREIAVEIPSAVPVEVDLQLATVAGRVTTEEGRPVAGVRLETERLDEAASSTLEGRDPWSSPPATDADGRFRLEGLADGAWRISAAKDGYAQEDRVVEISTGADVAGVDFVLRPTRGLWMDLRFPGTSPHEVGVVRLDGAGGVRSQAELSLDERGAVHLSSVPAGSWRFQVAAPGFATRSLVAEAPADRPTVTFAPEAGVEVTPGADVNVVALRLLHPDGTPHHFFRNGRLVDRARGFGSLRIDGVPAGRFVLVGELADGSERTKEIDVAAGRRIEVSFP